MTLSCNFLLIFFRVMSRPGRQCFRISMTGPDSWPGSFLDAIASPSSYPCQWVSELVIVSGVMLSHLRALRACFSTDKIQFLHTTEFFSTGTSCGKYEGTLGCSQKVHPAKENTHLCLRKRKHTHLAQKAEQAKQCNNAQQRDSNLLLLFLESYSHQLVVLSIYWILLISYWG